MLPIAAGEDIAADARAAIAQRRPEVVIVDCMLPAAIAAARSMGRPTVSLVHLLYGPARTQMLRDGGAWTTDLGCLNATHQALGLAPAGDGLAAREAPELVLVTAPRWFDIPVEFPPNVTHAGPLGIRGARPGAAVLRVHTTAHRWGDSVINSGEFPVIEGISIDEGAGDGRCVNDESAEHGVSSSSS
jgi:hypothetical protein